MTSVRPLAEADRAAWLALWESYLDFYSADVPQEVTDETWRRIMDPDGPIRGAGAEADGRLIGFVTWLYHPVTWSISLRCYLEDLFVAADARGRGAGRALIEAVYADADARGADKVYWWTNEDNAPARRLYDSVGRQAGMVKYQR